MEMKNIPPKDKREWGRGSMEGSWGRMKENVQRTHGQGQWVGDCLWEWGLDAAGENNGRKNGANYN